MNEFLRDRILRKLDGLSEERGYQVLDYVEFLESKYAERASPGSNVFTDMLEGIEDRLRAGRVSASAVAETMGFLNKAMGVLNGVAAAGKSVASDLYDAATRPAPGRPEDERGPRGGPPSSSTTRGDSAP